MWYLYIARCADKTIYVGVTNNLEKRILRHNLGFESLWIKQHGSAKIVYSEQFEDYRTARKRESQIKRWSRIKKEKLISNLL